MSDEQSSAPAKAAPGKAAWQRRAWRLQCLAPCCCFPRVRLDSASGRLYRSGRVVAARPGCALPWFLHRCQLMSWLSSGVTCSGMPCFARAMMRVEAAARAATVIPCYPAATVIPPVVHRAYVRPPRLPGACACLWGPPESPMQHLHEGRAPAPMTRMKRRVAAWRLPAAACAGADLPRPARTASPERLGDASSAAVADGAAPSALVRCA